jgi:hypothetical protein
MLELNMKVLFTRGLWNGHSEGYDIKTKQKQQDYQADSALHGFKKLIGSDAIDAPRIWSSYKTEFESGRHSFNECYGKGFTVCGNLTDEEDQCDRTDIEGKLKSGYFDLVILSALNMGSPYMKTILDTTPKNKLIVLDGSDRQNIVAPFVEKSLYFKRELAEETSGVFPISFAFPAEKIRHTRAAKKRVDAFINCNDKSTYIYEKENSYYQEYAESLFGNTNKKGGWECMRHYEVMANRCIPYFVDIDQCPIYTCTTLPKYEFSEVVKMRKNKRRDWFLTREGNSFCDDIEQKIFDHFKENCTTITLAKYILDTHKKAIN